MYIGIVTALILLLSVINNFAFFMYILAISIVNRSFIAIAEYRSLLFTKIVQFLIYLNS